MSVRDVQYFYMVTIQMVNPTGGYQRMASASGQFTVGSDLTERGKFWHTIDAAKPELKLGSSSPDVIPVPELWKYSILFYMCVKE